MGLKRPIRLHASHQKQLAYFVEQADQYLRTHQLTKAENAYRQALLLAPYIPEIHNNLGSLLKEQGRQDEALAAFMRAVNLRPGYASAHSNLLFTMQYTPGQTLERLRIAHEKWGREQLKGIKTTVFTAVHREGNSPIVVGLVSPDFYAHPVGVLLLPWLENHNREAFRLIAYSDIQRDDPISRRIRSSVDEWRDITGKDTETVAVQISNDQVDILIDLAGHTASNRLKLFARRAAPLQVSWIGYSATTGVPAMDAVLMDGYIAPLGVEAYFTEKVVRLEGLRFCYTPPSYAPEVSTEPANRKGHITFGSFNNLAKITSEVIDVWATILKSVPTASLVLKWKSLDDAETRGRLIREFAQQGISESRIECRGWSSHPQLLAEYADIDIALDPFPFSGGLTSCDALYMGVPILTFSGELPISRQTGSFLAVVGLPDWIATSKEEYLDKAVNIAKRPALLTKLRQTMRRRLLDSRLCDGRLYAAAVEKGLNSLIENKC